MYCAREKAVRECAEWGPLGLEGHQAVTQQTFTEQVWDAGNSGRLSGHQALTEESGVQSLAAGLQHLRPCPGW